jgi:hypothetical protein
MGKPKEKKKKSTPTSTSFDNRWLIFFFLRGHIIRRRFAFLFSFDILFFYLIVIPFYFLCVIFPAAAAGWGCRSIDSLEPL